MASHSIRLSTIVIISATCCLCMPSISAAQCKVRPVSAKTWDSPQRPSITNPWHSLSQEEHLRLAEYYAKHNLLQEEAWELYVLGHNKEADSRLNALETIMNGKPTKIELSCRRFPKGRCSNDVYKVHFSGGVVGLFKEAHVDPHGGTAQSEVAAYLVDRLFDFNLTPLTLIRNLDVDTGVTKTGSIQYFVADTDTGQKAGLAKSPRLRFFDAVVGNIDRSWGNWLVVSRSGKEVAIDHNLAFNHEKQGEYNTCWQTELAYIDNAREVRRAFDAYESASESDIKAMLGQILTKEQMEAFLKARKSIVRQLSRN